MSHRALAWALAVVCMVVIAAAFVALVRLDRATDDESAEVVRPQDLDAQRGRFEQLFREAWIPPPGPMPPHRTTECIHITAAGQLSLVRGAGTGDARWDAAVTAAMKQVVTRLAGELASPGLVCFGAPPEP